MNATNPASRSPAALAERYFEDGFLFPVDALNAQDARACRAQLDCLENRLGTAKVGIKSQLNYPHVIFRFANEIVRSPRILDVVESIIGPDIFVWGSTFFIKEPNTDSFVSWHQDLRYWGLSDDNGQVSAWIALSPVNRSNGCMRFVPGSHKGGMIEHIDTFEDNNFLTRGQKADVRIDESKVTLVEL